MKSTSSEELSSLIEKMKADNAAVIAEKQAQVDSKQAELERVQREVSATQNEFKTQLKKLKDAALENMNAIQAQAAERLEECKKYEDALIALNIPAITQSLSEVTE